MNSYEKAAQKLSRCRNVVALTGAGISVESGIPDFRSEGGLWSKYNPMEYALIDAFYANPGKVWEMLVELDELLERAEPNPAHYALAEMEARGILKVVITQNIDSLHQKAGSGHVIEFHGHNRTLRCDRCGRSYERETVSLEKVPPMCVCGDPIRPEIVFFGENIPPNAYRESIAAVRSCDMMIIVGTSATVAPASFLPRTAKDAGAFILEVNPTPTGLTHSVSDLHIAEAAGKALPAILGALNGIMV